MTMYCLWASSSFIRLLRNKRQLETACKEREELRADLARDEVSLAALTKEEEELKGKRSYVREIMTGI